MCVQTAVSRPFSREDDLRHEEDANGKRQGEGEHVNVALVQVDAVAAALGRGNLRTPLPRGARGPGW